MGRKVSQLEHAVRVTRMAGAKDDQDLAFPIPALKIDTLPSMLSKSHPSSAEKEGALEQRQRRMSAGIQVVIMSRVSKTG